MNDSRKSRLVLVISANLALAVLVILAIVNGQGQKLASKSGEASRQQSTVGGTASDATKATTASAADALSSSNSDPAPTRYPATTRSAASAEASRLAGHRDPMGSASAETAYPAANETSVAENTANSHQGTSKVSHLGARTPREVVNLPPPPDMPSDPVPAVARKIVDVMPNKMAGISVTAVIGNKAMLTLRHWGHRPDIVCLAAGEEIRTSNNVPISVVSVEPYRVTLDIDGDRFVKSLPEIR